jgi:beta-galactosidase
MSKKIDLLFFAFLLFISGFSQTTLFDSDWRFYRGGVQGAEMPGFDDSKWRKVDLPHDWSIEDLPGTHTPFDPDAISQVSGGFTVGGTGWYRKTFTIGAEQKNKRIHIQFDGVYMNADFWLNGESLGTHPYGYTSFWFDITDKMKFGEKNTIIVQVKNEGQNSRWYSGSGIYRHVWLKVLDPVHVSPWGIYIKTQGLNTSLARVNIKTSVNNESAVVSQVKLVTRIINSKGVDVARIESQQSINPNTSTEFVQELAVASPELWSIESPVLYTAITELYNRNELTEKTETKFGIRTLSFDASNGFQLNGKTIKLHGGCVHQDNGPLGSKAYDRAEERRIELLKGSGFNAIRCSHNPPSPAFLDACDCLGMLVLDEAFDMWRIANNPYDYHLYFDEWWQKDIESMVMRDRNHPSIIIWSIGNEIRDMENPKVIEVAKMLGGYIRQLEPTRPIVAAVNNLRPEKDPFFATLDVCGYNYAAGGDHGKESLYKLDHDRMPDRVMMGTESYAMEAFGAWMGVVDNPYVIGDFVWTAFDYIGEASIGWRGYWQESNFYPWNLAYCGDIDICGWKRPQSYYRDALWKENQVSLFVKPPKPSFPLNPGKQSWSKWEWHDVVADWTWPGQENKPMEVSVYSSCAEVELFLNGRSLGKRQTSRDTKFITTWQVAYHPGILKAIGYTKGKQMASSQLQTAKQASKIKLLADRSTIKADGQDLSYITVELTDANGIRNPKAENLVKFKIEGGTIVGVGNANPVSLESYQLPQRKAWQGRCLVIVKSSQKAGKIILTASVSGLQSAKAIVTTIK